MEKYVNYVKDFLLYNAHLFISTILLLVGGAILLNFTDVVYALPLGYVLGRCLGSKVENLVRNKINLK